MRELRLLPAALTLWAAVMAVLVTGTVPLAGLIIATSCAVVLVFRQYGQAITVGVLGVVGSVVAAMRLARSERWEQAPVISGVVAGEPRVTNFGNTVVELRVAGNPFPVTVFVDEVPEGVHTLVVDTEKGDVLSATEPTGWSASIRSSFVNVVAESVSGAHAGLIPGMVVGDTSLQSAASEDMYVATGLSHLSAVSGSNVAIVTSAAVMLCRALGLGPRVQTGTAALALIGFVIIVGLEPSVLRAAVTGLVGLAAVINSSRMEPMHALAMSVIVLVMIDSELAVNFGFALSVAATAGIVGLSRVLARPFRMFPPIVARAIGVALAADVVTMPIIALMSGKVSLVGVVANLLVAPVTAPITVIGLMAAGLSVIPGPLAGWVVHLISPGAWWIHTVARIGAAVPMLEIDPVVAVLVSGWLVYILLR